MKKHFNFETVETNYIRVLCQSANNNNYGYSIFEVEVYQQRVMETAEDAITLIDGVAPTISNDGKNIVLPQAIDGYDVTLFGTDNEQVVINMERLSNR